MGSQRIYTLPVEQTGWNVAQGNQPGGPAVGAHGYENIKTFSGTRQAYGTAG